MPLKLVNGRQVEITNPEWLARIDGKPAKPKQRARVNVESVARLAKWVEEVRAGPGIFIPIYLRNPLNRKQHWTRRRRDVKAERDTAFAACIAERVSKRLPVRVQMTRFGPRRLDPQNIPITLKAIIDGVADYFGADDGLPCYEWLPPKQSPSPPGCYGVRIEFEYPGRGKK